jgi:hypothetical protein
MVSKDSIEGYMHKKKKKKTKNSQAPWIDHCQLEGRENCSARIAPQKQLLKFQPWKLSCSAVHFPLVIAVGSSSFFQGGH